VIRFGKLFRCGKIASPTHAQNVTTNNDEQQHLKVKLNDEQAI
jgi:hypothetical protein